MNKYKYIIQVNKHKDSCLQDKETTLTCVRRLYMWVYGKKWNQVGGEQSQMEFFPHTTDSFHLQSKARRIP